MLESLRVALPQGPVDVPGLAEPAAADAPAHDLDCYPVVHDVDVRDHLVPERRNGVQVTHDALMHHRLIWIEKADLA